MVTFLRRKQILIPLLFIGSLISLYILGTKFSDVLTTVHGNVNRLYRTISKEKEFILNLPNLPTRNTVPRFEGVTDGDGCTVREVNPFDETITKFMHDFGDHICTVADESDVQVNISGSNISMAGKHINSIRIRTIVNDSKEGYAFKDFEYLEKPVESTVVIQRNLSGGAIRNVASSRCIIPDPKSKPGSAVIEVVYSKKCDGEESKFNFTQEGLLVHQATSKCLGPREKMDDVPDNTKLYLADICDSHFNVLFNGVLQLAGESPKHCIHPLWGGSIPEEGQQLCLYSTCANQDRLTYNWFKSSERDKSAKMYSLSAEMTHIQIEQLDESILDKYFLSIVPQVHKSSPSEKPNIVVIAIEEASAAHFKRKLQYTHVAMSKIGFQQYDVFASVHPSSSMNFLAMLSGRLNITDEHENSILKMAELNDYITMFSADDPIVVEEYEEIISAHHNALPFFKTLKKHYSLHSQGLCVSGVPIYDVTFNYLTSFLKTYRNSPKLAILLLSEITAYNYNYLGYMDKHFMSLLEELKSLENTVVIVQTLKGGEKGKLVQIEQGVEEIKRPLLATYVSKDIKDKITFQTSRLNQMTTPYDIHATLHHIINNSKVKTKYGTSLLESSKAQNCLEASVLPIMCPCVK